MEWGDETVLSHTFSSEQIGILPDPVPPRRLSSFPIFVWEWQLRGTACLDSVLIEERYPTKHVTTKNHTHTQSLLAADPAIDIRDHFRLPDVDFSNCDRPVGLFPVVAMVSLATRELFRIPAYRFDSLTVRVRLWSRGLHSHKLGIRMLGINILEPW